MALVPAKETALTQSGGSSLISSVLSGVFGFGLPVLKRVLLWYGNVVHKSLAIQLNRQFSKYGEWVPTSTGYSFIPKPEYSDSLPDQGTTTRGDFDYKNLEPLAEGAEGAANWLWSKRRRPETGGNKVVPYSGPKIEEIDMYRPRAPRVAPAAKRPVAHLDALMTTGRMPRVTRSAVAVPAKAPPRGRSAAAPVHRVSPVENHMQVTADLQAEHSLPKEQRLAARQTIVQERYSKRRPVYNYPGHYGKGDYKAIQAIGGDRKRRDIWSGRGRAYARHASPLAVGSSYTQKFGKMTEQKDGITFSKKELLAEVTSQSAFNLLTYVINPGLATTFPFLSQIAKLFQEYIFVKLKFYVAPRVATTSSCGLFQAMLTNFKVPAPTSVQELMTITGATESASYKPRSIRISPEDLQLTGPTRAVRVSALDNVENSDLYDVGRFFLARSGGDATLNDDAVGDLYVSYTVKLFNPIPDVASLAPQEGYHWICIWKADSSLQNTAIKPVTTSYNPTEPTAHPEWQSSNDQIAWCTQDDPSDATFVTLPQGAYVLNWYAKCDMGVAGYPVLFGDPEVTVFSGTVTQNYSPLTATTTQCLNVNDSRLWGWIGFNVTTSTAVIALNPQVANIDCVVLDFGIQIHAVDPQVYDNWPNSLEPEVSTLVKEQEEIKKNHKEVESLKDQVDALTKLVRGMKLIQDHPIPPVAQKIPSGKKF